MRWRTALLTIGIFLASSCAAPSWAANPVPGKACSKAGAFQTYKSLKYTCVKSGKKLTWSKGVRTVVAKSTPNPSNNSIVSWQFDSMSSSWISRGKVPICPTPLIASGEFVDFSRVLSILQPGQSRGGSYKPHGGLRWSVYGSYVKGVTVTAPFDGEIVAAAQYMVGGIFQFGVNIIHPCGVMLRLGHLQEPSDYMKTILKNLPPPVENDSRESLLSGIFIKKGQMIATEVGMPPPASADELGTHMDLGILNLLKRNPLVSTNFTSNADVKYSLYSVCWYEGDYFSVADKARLLTLPFANGDSTSDYCKKR